MGKQPIWTVKDGQVLRHGLPIADITRFQNGKMQWDGMGLHRRGFHSEQELMQDVMYFHQHWIARQRRREAEEATSSAVASSAAAPGEGASTSEGSMSEGPTSGGSANA